jgi:flagellar biosynthesis regulator FlaF
MIQSYMTYFKIEMRKLDDSMAMIEAMLEKLSYQRIEALYNQLEVWTTYLQRKIS